MGYASLIEDIIERFDNEPHGMLRIGGGRSPSSEAVAERQRLELEKRATAIAVREFQRNQRQAKINQAAIASLKSKVARAGSELREIKSTKTWAANANKELNRALAHYRNKYAEKIRRLELTHASLDSGTSTSLITKIENMQEADFLRLNKERQGRFTKIKAFASSQRRLEAQAIELKSLTTTLENITAEVQILKNLLSNIDRNNQSLRVQQRTFQNWDVMDEWLRTNPKFAPKEHSSGQAKRDGPFNPVLPEQGK